VPSVLTDQLLEITGIGPAVILGTRDARLAPTLIRAWGIQLLPAQNEVRLCIAECSARRVLENIADNHRVAITLVRPTTYRSIQLKGRALGTGPASDGDLEQVRRHRAAFVEEAMAVDLAEALAARLFQAEMDVSPTMVLVRVAIDEIFDQTPGPSAGARL
jgi:hypothetical protein